MEVFFEQSVENDSIDKHKVRTTVFTVIRYVSLIIGVIVGIFGIMFTDVGNGWLTALVSIAFSIFMIVPFILLFIFLGRFISKTSLEFDYVINGDVFRIIKVVNRKKRKLFVNTPVSSFESLGSLNSDAYDRYAGSKEIKKQFALTDYSDENKIYYIYYVKDAVKYLLHIQPDNEMIGSLRKCVTRITVLDKSFKILENPEELKNLTTEEVEKKKIESVINKYKR